MKKIEVSGVKKCKTKKSVRRRNKNQDHRNITTLSLPLRSHNKQIFEFLFTHWTSVFLLSYLVTERGQTFKIKNRP